ncbi:hypothetical protein F6X53_25435 [Methylobacterium soli]|uniref:Uncharacterized protein n=1 Tax=Methylobacterium soli TaxID=553447 RepID=A0A6L3SV78_9HYPH|nr:hypothetical protein F6X53_25435 [Methylobacterium soli]
MLDRSLDQLHRTDLQAPQDGAVHQITVHTISGLVPHAGGGRSRRHRAEKLPRWRTRTEGRGNPRKPPTPRLRLVSDRDRNA